MPIHPFSSKATKISATRSPEFEWDGEKGVVYKQTKDGVRDADEIKYKGYVLSPWGDGKYNVYPPAENGKKVAPVKSGVSLEEAKKYVDGLK
jgi:hypothetical protein